MKKVKMKKRAVSCSGCFLSSGGFYDKNGKAVSFDKFIKNLEKESKKK